VLLEQLPALFDDLVDTERDQVDDRCDEQDLERVLQAAGVADELDPGLHELRLQDGADHDDGRQRDAQFLVVYHVEDGQDDQQAGQRLENKLREVLVDLGLLQLDVDQQIREGVSVSLHL